MATIAIYAGSFDPITRGHEDLIHRSCAFVDKVVVAVANNSSKKPLFSPDERVDLIRTAVGNERQVEVLQFQGLLVNFAREVGASLIIRGLRAVSDFEYEFQMALMNRRVRPALETFFLMPREEYSYVSSRLVKEVASLGGDVSAFVPAQVAAALRSRYASK